MSSCFLMRDKRGKGCKTKKGIEDREKRRETRKRREGDHQNFPMLLLYFITNTLKPQHPVISSLVLLFWDCHINEILYNIAF